MTHVLDACALIAWIKNEPGSDVVDGLLDKAEYGDIDLFINIVNLVEVYYGFIKELGQERAQEIIQTVRDTAIEVIDTTNGAVFEEVARLKSSFNKFSFFLRGFIMRLPWGSRCFLFIFTLYFSYAE
jgi:predicted nucleic acid-binding protein